MQLEQLIQNRTPGETVYAHNWNSYCWRDEDGYIIVNINHHWTQMLQFRQKGSKPYYPIPVRYISHVDLGWGSKSDQDGMNRIFRALGIPWHYSRKGGTPHIIDLVKTPRHRDLPKYLSDPTTRREVYGYSA